MSHEAVNKTFTSIVAAGSESSVAIDKFLQEQKAEDLWLEFTRASTNESGDRKREDRENFAKTLCAFANSEGGVIVWGVKCVPDAEGVDVATALVPVSEVLKFRKRLEDEALRCVSPWIEGLEFHVVRNEDGSGFVAVKVPEGSLKPYRAILSGADHCNYYVRLNSRSVLAPHSLLEGMFGGRPKPLIKTYLWPHKLSKDGSALRLDFHIGVKNEGPIPTDGVYGSFNFSELPNKNFINDILDGPQPDAKYWHFVRGAVYGSGVSHSGFRVAPWMELRIARVILNFAPPFDGSFRSDFIAGCASGTPNSVVVEFTPSKLQLAYDSVNNQMSGGGSQFNELCGFALTKFFPALGVAGSARGYGTSVSPLS